MMYGSEECHLVRCPYNPNHIIRSYRLPYHIRKCKKNHPDIKLENCSYNFSHLMKREDILDHMEICPNKYRIESNCYDASSAHKSCENQYDENFDEKTDDGESSFRLIEPLKKPTRISEKDKSDYIDLQEYNKKAVKGKGSVFNSEVNELLDEDDELIPLQLPKTMSKAFRIKKSS